LCSPALPEEAEAGSPKLRRLSASPRKMADILEGTTDHSSHAPLSQAQTIAVCKHLQLETRNLQVELSETKRELQHTLGSVQAIMATSKEHNELVQNVTKGQAEMNLHIAKLQEDLARSVQATQGLKTEDQANKHKILQLEETKKMIETHLDVITNDLQQQKDLNQKVQDEIANRIDGDIKSLHKTLENTKMALGQTDKEQEHIAAVQKETQGSLREAHVGIENVLNEVKKTNTVTNILENRLVATAKGVQLSSMKLAELSDGAIKINECYEQTRVRSLQTEAQLREMTGAQHSLQQHLDNAIRQIESNADRLAQSLKLLDEESANAEETRHQINGLKQNNERVWKKITDMAKYIEEVNNTAQQIRAGVKQQSQLLLPNIHMDHQEVHTSSRVHGSLLMSGDLDSLTKAGGGKPKLAAV